MAWLQADSLPAAKHNHFPFTAISQDQSDPQTPHLTNTLSGKSVLLRLWAVAAALRSCKTS
jgi:hypothetical protein